MDGSVGLGVRRKTLIGIVVGATLVASLVVSATPTERAHAASPPSAADSAVLAQWNQLAVTEAVAIRPTAHGQTRGIAMVQGAVYDAVNAIDRGHEPFVLDLGSLEIDADASYSAAIATAAYRVLLSLVAPGRVPALSTAYDQTILGIDDGSDVAAGVGFGEAAASAMIASRVGDGYLVPFDFAGHVGTGPGEWDPAALDPDAWVADLRTFVIDDADRFGTNGPHPLQSSAYAKDFAEVKAYGAKDSTVRTEEQRTVAIFWQFAPAVMWNQVVRDIADQKGLDALEEARILAMSDLAAADGAVACWNDKYTWDFWRPVTAIRKADIDGNDKTVADVGWVPLFDPSTPVNGAPLSNPPFPDHPSGHGCVSGAVLATLRQVLGTDHVTFDVYSGRFPGQPRHFETFSQAIDEIVDSRVWGGIHFRHADEEGAQVGKRVANWIVAHDFKPQG